MTIGCKTKAQEKTVKPVKVKTVETHSGTSSVRYSASIMPSSQVEIAFKVGGYVESIKQADGRHIQAGDVVYKGAVLAQLRQSDYAAKVNEAKSQQGEARSALETSSAQLKEAITAVETSKRTAQGFRSRTDASAVGFRKSGSVVCDAEHHEA